VQSSSFPSYITDIDTFTPAVLYFLCYKQHDSPLKQGLKATDSRRERNNENYTDTENGDPVIALSFNVVATTRRSSSSSTCSSSSYILSGRQNKCFIKLASNKISRTRIVPIFVEHRDISQ
jgi:hypothetical protein